MKLQYNDQKHQYWLDGTRAKSISKVADIVADKFTVEQWSKRIVAVGMTLDQTLIERVAVDLDNRDAIQEVCNDAARTAKAHARANRGTQRHRVFELLLLGRENEFITDQQRADAVVLARTLDAYGLEPIPSLVEQFVAYPDHCVVGRFDAVMRYKGAPALFDLKGGPNAVKYPHSTLTQTALYRFAPHVSAKIERNGDKSVVTEWTTFPDGTDEDVAYVIYCDDDHDVGELWRLDLAHGRAGAELALAIVDWRKANNYGKGAVKQTAPGPDKPADGPVERAAGEDPPSSPAAPTSKCKSCGAAIRWAKTEAGKAMPLDATPFPDGNILLSDHGVATVINPAAFPDELLYVSHFYTCPHANKHRKGTWTQARRKAADIDEMGDADQGDVNTAKGRYELGMDAEQQAWTGQCVKDATEAGWDFRLRDKPTQRRADLYCAITKLICSDYWGKDFDGVVRALLYATTHEEQVLGASAIGPWIGQLDGMQALLLRQHVDHLIDGTTVLVSDDTGKLAVQAAA